MTETETRSAETIIREASLAARQAGHTLGRHAWGVVLAPPSPRQYDAPREEWRYRVSLDAHAETAPVCALGAALIGQPSVGQDRLADAGAALFEIGGNASEAEAVEFANGVMNGFDCIDSRYRPSPVDYTAAHCQGFQVGKLAARVLR